MFRSRAIQAVYGTCPWRHAWSPRYHGFVNLSSDAGLRSTKGKAELLSAPSGGAACDQSLSLLLALLSLSRWLAERPGRYPSPRPVNPWWTNIMINHLFHPRPLSDSIFPSTVHHIRPFLSETNAGCCHITSRDPITQVFLRFIGADPDAITSRLLWGATADPPKDQDKKLYLIPTKSLPPIKLVPTSVSMSSIGPVSPKKGRRISNDMVSKPIEVVSVCDHYTSQLSLNLGQPFSARI